MQLVHNGLDADGGLGLRLTAGSLVEPGFGEDKSHETPPWLLVIGTTGMKSLYVRRTGNAKSLRHSGVSHFALLAEASAGCRAGSIGWGACAA